VSMLTMKFGGTSVGSAEAIGRAAEIVQSYSTEWDHVAVVVSAMNGVTDILIGAAEGAARGNLENYQQVVASLRTRHHQTIEALIPGEGQRAELLRTVDSTIDEFASLCHGVSILGEVTPRAMDTISSMGERINARVVAAALCQIGIESEAVDATRLIVTDNTFRNAVPLMEETQAQINTHLKPMIEKGILPVITGFMGATKDGLTTTLGRGGSDYSAAIIAVCLDSDQVWTWTDVDGVMTADPKLIPDAQIIPLLSYAEVSELAYFGAKVLHPRTIRPVVERNIPLWVKNTFNPTCPGSEIVRDAENTPGTVKAVTTIRGMSIVTVEGTGMMGVPGIAARTFSAVASRGASVLMIIQASSEQSICFVIPTGDVPDVLQALEEQLALELARRDIERVWALNGVNIVTAVGAGMRHTPGVAARIFSALAEDDINIIAIAQGSSDCSISLVLKAEDELKAIRQIHAEVIANA